MLRDAFDLATEREAQAEERACPQDGTHAIVKKKAANTHVKDAGERRGDGAQAGKKFSNQQRAGASFCEHAFSAAHAGIRLEGYLAEKL